MAVTPPQNVQGNRIRAISNQMRAKTHQKLMQSKAPPQAVPAIYPTDPQQQQAASLTPKQAGLVLVALGDMKKEARSLSAILRVLRSPSKVTSALSSVSAPVRSEIQQSAVERFTPEVLGSMDPTTKTRLISLLKQLQAKTGQ